MQRFLVTALLCLTAPVFANTPAYQLETVAEGLNHPWSLAFLPDGRMLVTERVGTLRIIADERLLPDAVTGVPDVYARSQGGLFEVLPDPAFTENRLLYLSLAHGTARANATRIVRGRLEGNALRDVTTVFTASPNKRGPVHYGGRMSFGPDGHLFLTLGDGYDYREQSQSIQDHLGTIIRIHPDGSIPADNPFVAQKDAKPEIFSYGHRNPQGIVFLGKRLLVHEHGPKGGDELNHIRPGRNYGWPIATYGVDYNGAIISPFTELPDVEPPLLHWTPSIAPSGMTVYQGQQFPAWQGDLFISALAERSVHRVRIKGTQVVADETLFTELGERIRDIRSGPDGALYLLTDSGNGRVLRISAKK